MGHELEGLPVLSFIEFAVANTYVHILVIDAFMFKTVGNTRSNAGALSQRTSGHVNARC